MIFQVLISIKSMNHNNNYKLLNTESLGYYHKSIQYMYIHELSCVTPNNNVSYVYNI